MASNATKLITLEGLARYHEGLMSKLGLTYVAQEAGKGLSEENFTSELKVKLDSMGTNQRIATDEDMNDFLGDLFGDTAEAGAGSDEVDGGGTDLDEIEEVAAGAGTDDSGD